MLAEDHILNISTALGFNSFVEMALFLILYASLTLYDVFDVRPTQGQPPCQPNMDGKLSHN